MSAHFSKTTKIEDSYSFAEKVYMNMLSPKLVMLAFQVSSSVDLSGLLLGYLHSCAKSALAYYDGNLIAAIVAPAYDEELHFVPSTYGFRKYLATPEAKSLNTLDIRNDSLACAVTLAYMENMLSDLDDYKAPILNGVI